MKIFKKVSVCGYGLTITEIMRITPKGTVQVKEYKRKLDYGFATFYTLETLPDESQDIYRGFEPCGINEFNELFTIALHEITQKDEIH